MKFIWETIKRDLSNRQNIDIYLTILVSLIIGGLGFFDIVGESQIRAALLAVLAILSLSLLISRASQEKINQALENHKQSIQKTIEKIEPPCLSDRFFREDYPGLNIQPYIREAQKAYFWGFAFTSTIPTLRDDFENGLINGLELKFLFIKPDSDASKMAVKGSEKQDKNEFDRAVRGNLLTLSSMSKRHLKQTSKKSIEIKVFDYLPPFSIIAVDPHLPRGKMFVRIASYQMDRSKVPWFELEKKIDKNWFEVFSEQFETVWNNAEDWNPKHK